MAKLVVAREQVLSGFKGSRPWQEYKSAAVQDVETLWERTFQQRKEFSRLVNKHMRSWDICNPSTWKFNQ